MKVVPIKVKWITDKDISDFIKEIADQIPDNSKNDYIFGFSIGAYIAINLSKKKKCKGYIFCTTSPFFKKKLKKNSKRAPRIFWRENDEKFCKISYSQR